MKNTKKSTNTLRRLIHKNMKFKALVLFVILLSSCSVAFNNTNNENIILATEPIISKEISLEPFGGIQVNGFHNVTFIVSEEYSIAIEISENIFELLDLDLNNLVERGVLNLPAFSPGYGLGVQWGSFIPKVYIYGPSNLQSLSTGGSSDIYFSNTIYADNFLLTTSGFSNIELSIETEHLELDASGSSNITLGGSSNTTNISSEGFSNIEAPYFHTKYANITTSGSSNIYIYVSESLTTTQSGFSSVVNLGSASLFEE